MSSFKKLFKFVKLNISVFIIKEEIILLSNVREITKIKNNKIKEIVKIFIEKENISFDAKDVT